MTVGHWLVVAAFFLAIVVPAVINACLPKKADTPNEDPSSRARCAREQRVIE